MPGLTPPPLVLKPEPLFKLEEEALPEEDVAEILLLVFEAVALFPGFVVPLNGLVKKFCF